MKEDHEEKSQYAINVYQMDSHLTKILRPMLIQAIT